MNNIINVRYIQRIKESNGKVNPFSFGGGLRNGGLDDLTMISITEFALFDYMGAAEYEFGALPEAFGEMTNNPTPLIIKKIKLKGKSVFLLTNENLMGDATEVVKKLGSSKKMEWKLKCPSHFKSSLENVHESPFKGWIDIENAYMFFLDEKMANKFYNLLNNKRSK